MRSLVKVSVSIAALVGVFGAGWFVASLGVGSEEVFEDLNELEQQFVERMQGVVLVGHFTVEGQENPSGNPERYEIESVTKVGENSWRFNTHLTYGNIDATLPIVMPIVWAGDTPMVSITDFSIPTLGTFTSRVIFYSDRYAGSWQHGEYGGVMYGTITRP